MQYLKAGTIFAAKAFTFSIIFVYVWAYLARPASSETSKDTASAQAIYESQLARTNRQYDAVEAQQKKADEYLEKARGSAGSI